MQLHSLPVSTYHALSLNEMGAVPGGAFRAFWEPLYRMSISGSTIRTRIYQTHAHGNKQGVPLFHHCLTLFVHKDWCCSKWSNCVYQKEAVMSARDMTESSVKYGILLSNYMQTFVLCCVWERTAKESHFLQMSPIPSTGWQRPAEDSPCVRKNRTGLCFSIA